MPRWHDVVLLVAMAMTNTVFAATPKIASDLRETAGARRLDKVATHGGTYKATLTGMQDPLCQDTAVWGSSAPGSSSTYGATGIDVSRTDPTLAIGDPQN